ncbi:5-hydroxytryptamine receptor 3A [Gastrophryne carolinensis]
MALNMAPSYANLFMAHFEYVYMTASPRLLPQTNNRSADLLRNHTTRGYKLTELQAAQAKAHALTDNIYYGSKDEKHHVMTTYIWYNQSWIDEFLIWDPLKYDNLTRITVPTDWLWIPDIMIVEYVNSEKDHKHSYVYIEDNGRVANDKPMQIESSCNMDIYYFPFDMQNCTLTFTSWIHIKEEINVSFYGSNLSTTFQNQKIGEWNIIKVYPHYNEVLNQEGDTFGEVVFYIIIKRSPLFYAVNLILPSAFLLIMDIAGFYLPPESGERTSFKITLLLGYSVFLIIVSDKLPASGTPLIAVYFILCMALLVLSLMESILIVRIVHQEHLHPEVPNWLKKLIIEKIAPLLRYRNWTPFVVQSEDSLSLSEHLENTIDKQANEDDKQLSITRDPELLLSILKEVSDIRTHLKKNDHERNIKEWLHVSYIVDKLFFRAYLIVLFLCIVSIGAAWIQWAKH